MLNRMTEKLFGYRREELLGQPLETLLPDELRASHVHNRDAYRAQPVIRRWVVVSRFVDAARTDPAFPLRSASARSVPAKRFQLSRLFATFGSENKLKNISAQSRRH